MSRRAGTVHRRLSRSGMTLIELILAIALASLVVTLVFSVYRTVSTTLQGQDDRRRGADAVADAVQKIARDITCTFAPESDEACKFTLEKGDSAPAASQLSFCTAVLPEGETDLRWFELHRVAYHIGKDSKGGVVLYRENRPLAGPGAFSPPVTNVLATSVESFHISVYNGSEWNDEWGTAEAGCPRAARIELTATYGTGTKTFQTEVLIPVGNSVSSTVSRARVPANP
jgi:prepilin-type N-terminal cleavage/methylation domain-containing protein